MRNVGTKTVKMLKTMLGSPDGIAVNEYKEGGVYTMPVELAVVFLKGNQAKVVQKGQEEESTALPPDTKPAGLLILPEGMIPREAISRDVMDPEQMVLYAKHFFGKELKADMPRADLTTAVLKAQEEWETKAQEKLAASTK